MTALPRFAPIAPVLALLSLTGCVSDRHLVFFTNTNIGVEISSDPSTSQPVKFVLGYKRAEGVIDPLGNDQVSGTQSLGVNLLSPEGHSVLAKLNFGTSGGSASAQNAQWFATGEAARALASSEMAAAALTGSEEIAKQVVAFSQSKNVDDRRVRIAVMSDVYHYLNGIKGDPTTAALVAQLDAIDLSAFAPAFTSYESSGLVPDTLKETPIAALAPASRFTQLTYYYANLNRSVALLKDHVGPPANPNLKLERPGPPATATAATAAEITTLQNEFKLQEQRLAFFDDKLGTNPHIVAAARLFVSKLYVP